MDLYRYLTQGVVHDVLDTLLLDLLCKQAAVGRGGESLSGIEEYKVVLQSLDVLRVDEHGLDRGRDNWLQPGDGVGRDGAVDQVV